MIDAEILAFIEEIITQKASISASPGFTWGRSGTVRNSYLLNDTVSSNLAGRLSPVNGKIIAIFVTCDTNSTGEIEIRRRVGAVFTTLYTVSLGGGRKTTVTIPIASRPAIAINDELCVFVNNTASIKEPVVGLLIIGTSPF